LKQLSVGASHGGECGGYEVSSVLLSTQILPFFKRMWQRHWHTVNEHDSREMGIPATKLQGISAVKLGI
jgi:hypothetical protein